MRELIHAGGGGDGYYGGGSGGNGPHQGGGGGSGYLDPAFVVSGSGQTLGNPVNSNAPNIPARSPLQTANPLYGSSAGASVVNGNGNAGRLVLVY